MHKKVFSTWGECLLEEEIRENIVKHRLHVCLATHLRLARPAREVAVDAAEDRGVPGVGLQTHLDRAAVSDCK